MKYVKNNYIMVEILVEYGIVSMFGGMMKKIDICWWIMLGLLSIIIIAGVITSYDMYKIKDCKVDKNVPFKSLVKNIDEAASNEMKEIREFGLVDEVSGVLISNFEDIVTYTKSFNGKFGEIRNPSLYHRVGASNFADAALLNTNYFKPIVVLHMTNCSVMRIGDDYIPKLSEVEWDILATNFEVITNMDLKIYK